MTVSRSNRLLALAAGALLLGAAGARAQQAPPPYPPPHTTQPDQASGAPRALPGIPRSSVALPEAEGGNGVTQVPARPYISGHRRGGAVTVSSLGEVEGPPTGTLDAASGGLGVNLWSGSARGPAEQLMARLPISTTVAPVRALARRILLTKAAAPTGDAPQAFLTVRIRRLLDGGFLEDAGRLAALGDIKNDAGFARAKADALLYAGADAQVCGDATAKRLDSAEPFWIELRAYCYAAQGDDASLSLTRAVMSAQTIDDPAFDTLMSDVANGKTKMPQSIDAPTALHVYLLRKLGLAVPLDVGMQLGTPGLLLAAQSKDNPPSDRLEAAERIVRTGTLGPYDLAAIADAQQFTDDQFATEHAQVQALPFLAGQALLRQAVKRADPDARPALIYEALSTAENKDLLGVAAELQQEALVQITPTPDMRAMLGLFARALILTGHPEQAARWTGLLDAGLASDQPLLARLVVTLNLAAPNPERQLAAQQALSELMQEYAGKTPDQAFAALALGLYAALKEPMPKDAHKLVAEAMRADWPGRRPPDALLKRLDAAVRSSDRKGEALMLALNAMGPKGPTDLPPDVTVHVVRTLMKEGADHATRDIAIAALLRYRPAQVPVPAAAPMAEPAPAPRTQDL